MFSKFFKSSEPDSKTNQNSTTAVNSHGHVSPPKTRGAGIIIESAKELIEIFDVEFKKNPAGLVFEQGGYLEKGAKGWELYLPKKVVWFVANSDIDKMSQINFGFYAKNRAGEEGILLQLSERVRLYVDAAIKQGVSDNNNGASLLQMVFFSAKQIILHNHESFREFILKLGHNGDLANVDEKHLKVMLDTSTYVVMNIDNNSGETVDEYRYVPLVLEIEAMGSPREILHGKNWRMANRTARFVHTHLPTVTKWNELIRKYLNDERDELNTPPDILGLQHDIERLQVSKDLSSTIVTFELDRTPRVMRTFVMDLLSEEEQKELLKLAHKHQTTMRRRTEECYESELKEIVRYYQLVKKATVNGLPNIAEAQQA